MGKKFSKPELSRKINGDIPFDAPKTEKSDDHKIRFDVMLQIEAYVGSVLTQGIFPVSALNMLRSIQGIAQGRT